MRGFSVHIWHSEGWFPRNEALIEAVMKQLRTTRHPWLIACDANMSPADFDKSLWLRSRHMFIKAAYQKAQKVIASRSFQVQIRNMHVVEDVESKRRKAVSFMVEKEGNPGMARTKMPKAPPGFSGGKLSARSKGAKGKEEEDEGEESQERQMRMGKSEES